MGYSIEKFTNYLTPQSRVLVKLTVTLQIKNFLTFYGTKRFITIEELAMGCYPEPDDSNSYFPTLFL